MWRGVAWRGVVWLGFVLTAMDCQNLRAVPFFCAPRHATMCLTNVGPAPGFEVYNVTVAPCDGSVGQHWAVGVQRDNISSLSFATEVSLGLV